MFEISMEAALLIVTICFFTGFLLMLIYSKYIHMDSYANYFMAFFLVSTVGTLLILLRNTLSSDFVSIILANLLLISGYLFLSMGAAKLTDRKPNVIFIGSILLAFLSIFLIFTYLYNYVTVRVVTYNLFSMLILAKLIFDIRRNKKAPKLFDELMSPILCLMLITLTIRVIGVLVFTESTNDFLSFTRDSLMVAVHGIINLMIIVGLFSLINKKINENLIESERSKSSLLSSLPGFAYRCLVDEYWTMKFISEGFTRVTGYDIDEVIENRVKSFEDLIEPEFREQLRIAWKHSLDNHEKCMVEYRIIKKSGEKIWVWEQGLGIYDDNGQVIALEGYISDINSRKKLEQNLEYLGYHDYLTGLNNRRFIEGKMAEIESSGVFPVSLIIADVNGLKFVNDTYGHDIGDEIIKSVAEILNTCVTNSLYIARTGGDEFLVILEETSKADCKKIVQKIESESQKSRYRKQGLSIAVGFDTKESQKDSLDDVLKRTENNMYLHKQTFKSVSTEEKDVLQ